MLARSILQENLQYLNDARDLIYNVQYSQVHLIGIQLIEVIKIPHHCRNCQSPRSLPEIPIPIK